MRWARMPDRSWPPNSHRPWSGASKPVTRLNRVLLPAPLGPINAVMAPRCTSRWSRSPATRPPNDLRMPSTTRMGPGLATPGTGSVHASCSRVAVAASVTSVASAAASTTAWRDVSPSKRDLLLVAEDALGAEGEHQGQDQAHERQTKGASGLIPLQEPRYPTVVVELGQHRLGAGEDELEDHRAHDRPQRRGGAADDQDRVGEEGLLGLEAVGVHARGGQGPHDPAEGADDTADDEALHLVAEHVLAQAAGHVLVLPDRPDDPPPRAADQPVDQERAQAHEQPAHDQAEELGGRVAEVAEVEAAGERVEVPEVLAHVLQPERPAGEVGGRPRPGHEAQDLRGGDGHDGEVVGPQPQRRQTQQEREDHRQGDGQRDPGPHRQAPGVDGHPDAEGAEQHEPDLTEVVQTGVAEVEIEADRQQCEDRRLGAERGAGGVADDVGEVHQATRSFSPRMPWGRSSSTTMSTARAHTNFSSELSHTVLISVASPTTMPPTMAP